jgi:hypothetical protein
MAVGCVVLASPILFLFGGGKYLPGALGLEILAVMCLFATISGILDQTLLGTERVDVGEKPSFWSLIRSNLLFVPVANILYGVVYLSSLYLALSYSSSHGFSASSTVAIWATVQLAATMAFVLAKARRAKRYAKLMPSISVVYDLLAAALMAGAVYLISVPVLDQSVGTLSYGGRLLGVGILGAGIYFTIVYALDSKFRDMSRSFLLLVRR